jgi:hypothetical protein
MTSKVRKSLLALVFVLLGTGTSAPAAVLVVAPTLTATGVLTITEPINLQATVAGSFYYLVFSDWVQTSDGNTTATVVSPDIAFSVAGVAASDSAFLYNNNRGGPGFTLRDGYLAFSLGVPAAAVGDIISFPAGSYSLRADRSNSFNQQTTQTFTGNVYLVNSSNQKVSNTVAVPEPATALIMVTALVGLCWMRHRG